MGVQCLLGSTAHGMHPCVARRFKGLGFAVVFAGLCEISTIEPTWDPYRRYTVQGVEVGVLPTMSTFNLYLLS